MKKAAIILVLLFSLYPISIFCLEESIVIGREHEWKNVIFELSRNIDFQPGRGGFSDVLLKEAEYPTDRETDMLLHLNHSSLFEETGHYEVLGGKVTPKVSRYGGGAALFQRENVISITPRPGALFSPGTEWRDFSIEFWLYPANLEEGEFIFFWQGSEQRGSKPITQQVICTVRDRRLLWEFNNFFHPPDGGEYRIELTGESRLVPRKWKHHLIRFDSTTGLLEYLVDQVPEGIVYASKSKHEDGTVFLPGTGRFSSEPIKIGENFTGLIDEFRIMSRFVREPRVSKYKKSGGYLVTNLFDLGYSGSRLVSVDPLHRIPENTEILYFYQMTDIARPLGPDEEGWNMIEPGELAGIDAEGRYVQLMAQFFPDGTGNKTPVLSEIILTYEPDFPPTVPSGISAEPGDGSVTLSWNPVADTDVGGYMVYYGDAPGSYFGKGSSLGNSPVDVGNVTEVTLEGLENGRLYYFSIAAYDDSVPPHYGNFSREVSTRPVRSRGSQ
jgi:hypothetical protein